MGRHSVKVLTLKCKQKQHFGSEKETKDGERLKKKDLRKQSAREKDYGTSEEKNFSAALHSIQMKIRYMDGDGNCLFRSIADQLTGKCSNHHSIRNTVLTYIEERKEHFSLFMEDDEAFEDYISRMRTVGEWGGHQELYAASQSLHINIVVHQCSDTAPRFILSCDTAIRDIHLSYHGECHYNSVHHLTNLEDNRDINDLMKSISQIKISVDKPNKLNKPKPNKALEIAVVRALPWSSSTAQIQQALKMSGDDVDAAVELLMMNPDGLSATDPADAPIEYVEIALDIPTNTPANIPTNTPGNIPSSNTPPSDRPNDKTSDHDDADDDLKTSGNSNEETSSNKNEEPIGNRSVVPPDGAMRVARKKDRLQNKLSSITSKLSRKDQRSLRKEPLKSQDKSSAAISNAVPKTIGAGGIREVFL